jgi:hypothetical protein
VEKLSREETLVLLCKEWKNNYFSRWFIQSLGKYINYSCSDLVYYYFLSSSLAKKKKKKASIPTYLREGRLVPLQQKTLKKGPVKLDDIRPIVVRSQISKIIEKAILTKVRESCPHLIESKVYHTGFKEEN